MKVILFYFILVTFITAGQVSAEMPFRNPAVFVADFDLEVEDVHEGSTILPRSLGRSSGPIGKLRSSGNSQENPQAKAREMVDLMSDSLVKDLKDLGYPSRRLAGGESLPHEGILVRGLFANVDEGNRLRRAAIGFGAGHTDLQVIVSVGRLGKDALEPLYETSAGTQRGKMPGAIITMNPYVGAAKFVLAGGDIKRSITKTASNIASAIDKQIQSPTTRASSPDPAPPYQPGLDK